jgi:hypothetical protein
VLKSVRKELRDCLQGELLDLEVEDLQGAIIDAAAAMSVELCDNARTLARVGAVVGHVDAVLQTAQQAGDLRFFNQAYKTYRANRRARGLPAMNYQMARARLKVALLSLPGWRREPMSLLPSLCEKIFADPVLLLIAAAAKPAAAVRVDAQVIAGEPAELDLGHGAGRHLDEDVDPEFASRMARHVEL